MARRKAGLMSDASTVVDQEFAQLLVERANEQSWQSMCDFNVTDRLGEISTPTLKRLGSRSRAYAAEAELREGRCRLGRILHTHPRTRHKRRKGKQTVWTPLTSPTPGRPNKPA